VKALGYNLDLMRFQKKLVASDLFTNIQNDTWYAGEFVVAHYNGMVIPNDVNPNATMTRVQFANLIEHALEKRANLPMIKKLLEIKDEQQIKLEL
jgi:hypothetical protein